MVLAWCLMLHCACLRADANVTMVLTGEKGDTGERKLDSSAVSVGVTGCLIDCYEARG